MCGWACRPENQRILCNLVQRANQDQARPGRVSAARERHEGTAFSAFTRLVGQQDGHPGFKN